MVKVNIFLEKNPHATTVGCLCSTLLDVEVTNK